MNADVIEQNIADLSLDLLKVLLIDKTTGHFIRWATDNYTKLGSEYTASQEIKLELITGINTNVIQPRVAKVQVERSKRTRDKAEVFTPSWICNAQNNLVDDAWFGRNDVFNHNNGFTWSVNTVPIIFPKGKTWKHYVDSRRLEVSCGEAPYLVSRYDTVSGKYIPIEQRIGLLDRKLRVVCENVAAEDEWFKWAKRAFQSTYGYDYQGDNVLLARENLIYTFMEYMEHKFNHKPSLRQLKQIATVISWNIWQMDGITLTAPYSEAKSVYKQLTIFDILNGTEDKGEPITCKVFDWRSNFSLDFRTMLTGG